LRPTPADVDSPSARRTVNIRRTTLQPTKKGEKVLDQDLDRRGGKDAEALDQVLGEGPRFLRGFSICLPGLPLSRRRLEVDNG
jgi:hypothetical protein